MSPSETRPPVPAHQAVMRGQGFYNTHSQLQRSAIAYGLPLLERAVKAVPLPEPGGAFLVADYGSSEGRNSLEPMKTVIGLVRRRASEAVPIAIVHNDQPANDFSSLFLLLESSPESYLRGASNVFTFATGRSFFERLFPAGQVSLGWSAIALHWLSKVPATMPDHIWTPRATGQLAEAFAKQGREDWQRFLEHRAHELRPGGRLVILAGAADERGLSGGEGLLDLANRALRELTEARALRTGEYERMLVPTYNRRIEEFREPFERGPLSAQLVLEECSPVVLPDPLWEQYEHGRDARAYAAALTAWFRAWSEPPLFRSLDSDRSPDARQQLVEDFYAALRRKIEADPSATRCRWLTVCLLIAKPDED
ncbi:MAG: SAM-dependent methyltransferase [Nitrospirota bacterium]